MIEVKETNIKWIGQIPKDWSLTAFQYVLNFTVGFTPSTSKSEFYDSDDYDWATIADLNTKYIVDTKNKLSQKGIDSSGKQPVKKGSLLYSFKLSTGKVAFAGKDLYTNEAILAIEPKEDRSLEYLYYMLPLILDHNANTNIYGAKIFNQEVINSTILPIPPKQTQIRIAEFLDKKTAEIDNIIEKKEALLLRLEEKKKAIINEAVTGKKVWNGDAWTKPTGVKDSGIEWIGEIPAHWEVKKLKYLIDYIESGCSVNAEDSPIENTDELGVLKTSCVYNYSFDDSENKKVFKEEYHRVKCPVKENTIIVSRMNTPELVGASGYVFKSNCNLFLPDRLWQLNFNANYSDCVEYISMILSSELYKRLYSRIATGSSPSMKNISQDSYLDIEIILPPITECIQILDLIKNDFDNLSRLNRKLSSQIEKLKEYRQAIISEAVTGKLEIV